MSNEEFVEGLNQRLVALDMSDQEVGDLLHVSRPTIERWKVGENLPFRGVRDAIMAALDKVAQK